MKNFLPTKRIVLTLLSTLLVTISTAQNEKWLAALSTVGEGNEVIREVVQDQDGNSYVHGYYSSNEFTFGDKTITGHASVSADPDATINDYFLAKLNDQDSVVWLKRLDGVDSLSRTWPMHLDVDSNGNILSIVRVESINANAGLIIDGDTVVIQNVYGMGSNYVIMMDTDGEVLWHKQQSHRGLSAKGLFTPSGDIFYIADIGNGAKFMIIGEDTIFNPNPFGVGEITVSRLSSSGERLWTKFVGGKYTEIQHHATVDQTGDLLMVGTFSSDTLSVGDDIKLPSDYGGGFILPNQQFYCKVGLNGQFDYAKTVPEYSTLTGGAGPLDVEKGIVDHMLVIRESRKSTDTWNGIDIPLGVSYALLDQSGDPVWLKAMTDTVSGRLSVIDLQFDQEGNGYVLIQFSDDTLAIAGDTVYNAGQGTATEDIVVIKIDAETYEASVHLKAGGEDKEISTMHVNHNGNIILAGEYTSLELNLSDDIKLENSDFPTKEAYFIVYGEEEITTSIADNYKLEGLNIYPNPSSNAVHVGIEDRTAWGSTTTVKISTLSGLFVSENTFTEGQDISIDVQDLKTGIYIMTVESKGKAAAVRLIKD